MVNESLGEGEILAIRENRGIAELSHESAGFPTEREAT
jgi:hypothetical protein